MNGRVVSFAWNHKGMGHASRLLAVHERLRAAGWRSEFYVEHRHRLIDDHGFPQLVIPTYPGNLIGDDWWGRGRAEDGEIADLVVGATLTADDVVLHDVVLHRSVYDQARKLGCAQFLIHRLRKDRPDPGPWLAEHAPAVDTVYVIGAPGERRSVGGLRVRGTDDVLRKPIGDEPVWRYHDSGLRIAVSAAGGGHDDAGEFLSAALAAVRRLGRPASVFVTTGPYFRGELVVPDGMPGPVRVVPYVDAGHSLYRDTDVVITLGGYNTVQELRRGGVRAVTVPGRRQLDDQRIRLDELAQRPGVVVAGADQESIASALGLVLAQSPQRTALPEPAGADEITEDVVRRVNQIRGAGGEA